MQIMTSFYIFMNCRDLSFFTKVFFVCSFLYTYLYINNTVCIVHWNPNP